jgi:uncharacterized protein YjiS (DUF1127 family)
MSTFSNTIKAQTATPSSVVAMIAGGAAAVASNLAARAERARVYGELSRMSDRDLADIGVSRADVARVAGY